MAHTEVMTSTPDSEPSSDSDESVKLAEELRDIREDKEAEAERAGESDAVIALRIALERKDKEVVDSAGTDAELIARAERAGLEAALKARLGSESVSSDKKDGSVETPDKKSEVEVKSLSPEEKEAEKAASWERLKDLRRKEKPLKHDEMVISGRTGEMKYDPEVVKTHIDRWREEEWLALLDDTQDHVSGVKLSPVEISAMVTYLKDQRAALPKEDSEQRARMADEISRLKRYDKAVLKQWLETGGASWEEMDKLRENGQEWNDWKMEVAVIEPKTPSSTVIEPPPPPPPPPPEPEPEPEPQVPTEERVKELGRKLELDIDEFAKAREDAERMFAGKEEKDRLARAQENLNNSFEAWSQAYAAYIAAEIARLDNEGQLIDNQLSDEQAKLQDLENAKADPARAEADPNLDEKIRLQKEWIEHIQKQKALKEQEIEDANLKQAHVINQTLLNVRKRVDDKMLEIRVNRHPKLAKFNEFLKQHPYARTAAGVVLTGIGITGTVTGLAPIAVVGFAGRSALGAFGAYNAARGVGEAVGNSQRFGVGELGSRETIREETQAEVNQTDIRRYSKRAGAALAAIVGAIGAYKLANAIADRPPTPSADHRYGSVNNPELIDRVHNGDYISEPQRQVAIRRLRNVIGDNLYNQLGEEQRETLLLLRNGQIDKAPEYFQHLAAGHFG